MTRKEASYFLGIREDATEEQIKRAYRYKAKLYHPDANPGTDTREYYIKAQMAYEYLMNNPYNSTAQALDSGMTVVNSAYNAPFYYANVYSNMPLQQQRPAKIFTTDDRAKVQYQKQKQKEKERKKVQQWENDNKASKLHATPDKMGLPKAKSQEEEILDKIRAIWIAETIKRQIDLDKQHSEALQRRKLYKAFMQQKIQEEDK